MKRIGNWYKRWAYKNVAQCERVYGWIPGYKLFITRPLKRAMDRNFWGTIIVVNGSALAWFGWVLWKDHQEDKKLFPPPTQCNCYPDSRDHETTCPLYLGDTNATMPNDGLQQSHPTQ